jgi:NADH-quinone oxidoreductase subunit C/D
MFNMNDFTVTTNILKESGQNYREHLGQHHVDLRPQNLLRWIEFCRDDLGYLTLVDIVAVDRQGGGQQYRFEVVYQLMSMGQHQRLHLHVHLDGEELLPRIRGFYANADWPEREQAELLGLRFTEGCDALMLPREQKVFPLRQDASKAVWPREPKRALPVLRFNPNKSERPYPEESYVWEAYDLFSRYTLGHFELQACYDPLRITDARVYPGYHHQGLEKLFQGSNWLHLTQLVDKLNVGGAPSYALTWIKLLEEVLGVTLPERAQALRIVFLEMARIAEHLTVFAEICQCLELAEFRLYIDLREKLYELFEKYNGQRQGLGIISLGGLRQDLPHGWIVEYQRTAEVIRKSLPVIHGSLVGQFRFRHNLEVGPIHPQSILQWGVTGPCMRASGLNYDLRKSRPIYFYQDIDFDIPVGIHGTAYDRYLIRYEEVFQSLRIITQVLDNLPLGDIVNAELDQDHRVLMERKLPAVWHYSGLESPHGEVGISLLPSDHSSTPARIKFKTPSFAVAQALPIFLRGIRKEQLRANLASFGLRRTEIDR